MSNNSHQDKFRNMRSECTFYRVQSDFLTCIQQKLFVLLSIITQNHGEALWPGARVLNTELKSLGFNPNTKRHVVPLSKTHKSRDTRKSVLGVSDQTGLYSHRCRLES